MTTLDVMFEMRDVMDEEDREDFDLYIDRMLVKEIRKFFAEKREKGLDILSN